ncbi:MAG: hypothetical protein OEV00_03035 [Acidobacteriota bacterium]|nr:hypothetical protein [Acidobacteriota bacterium]MDH3784283.1 hypothetical protein [Acidobacteriota bacterium]
MSGIRTMFDNVREALGPYVEPFAPFATWLLVGSLLTMILTPVLTAYLIARIPPGYFLKRRAPLDGWRRSHPILRWSGLISKNVLGVLFLVAGLAMLVLPGQGILSIVLGLTLIDFPGKRRLQLWLLRKKRVIKSINWIRSRRGREPLLLPPRRS